MTLSSSGPQMEGLLIGRPYSPMLLSDVLYTALDAPEHQL